MIAILVYVISAATVLAALVAVAIVLIIVAAHREARTYEDTDFIFDCLECAERATQQAISERTRRVLVERERKELF